MTRNYLFKNAEVNSKVFVILATDCPGDAPVLGLPVIGVLRSAKSPETSPHVYTKYNLL